MPSLMILAVMLCRSGLLCLTAKGLCGPHCKMGKLIWLSSAGRWLRWHLALWSSWGRRRKSVGLPIRALTRRHGMGGRLLWPCCHGRGALAAIRLRHGIGRVLSKTSLLWWARLLRKAPCLGRREGVTAAGVLPWERC